MDSDSDRNDERSKDDDRDCDSSKISVKEQRNHSNKHGIPFVEFVGQRQPQTDTIAVECPVAVSNAVIFEFADEHNDHRDFDPHSIPYAERYTDLKPRLEVYVSNIVGETFSDCYS